MRKSVGFLPRALLVFIGLCVVVFSAFAASHPREVVLAVGFGLNQVEHPNLSPNIATMPDVEWHAQARQANKQGAEVLDAWYEAIALSHVNQRALAESAAHASDDEEGRGEHITNEQLARLHLARP